MYHAQFDVYLGEHDVFQPDILFVSNERRSILTERGAEGAPDFVVEILSPRTARIDHDNKRQIYARHGVDELWIIEPATIFSEGNVIEPTRFPGLRIDTRDVFAQ